MSGGVSSPELLQAAREGDNQACEQVLEENNGLIWSIVRRYYGRGVEPEDLYQLGCLGFLKAVRGYDPEYGTQFSTYAVPKIAGEIRRFLRDDGTVKVSRSLKERGVSVRALRSRLTMELGREPVLSELAAETGLTPEEIAAAEAATDSVTSLQAETGERGLTLEGMLGSSGMEETVVERLSLLGAAGAAGAAAALLQRPDPDKGGQCVGDLTSSGIPLGAQGGGSFADDFGRNIV